LYTNASSDAMEWCFVEDDMVYGAVNNLYSKVVTNIYQNCYVDIIRKVISKFDTDLFW